jgi:hypothetical protein
MFGIILISVCTLMHIYVFWRALSVPFVGRHVSKRVFMAVAVSLWVVFYLGRTWGHGHTGIGAAAVEFMGMSWMGVLFLTFVSLLAVDVVTLFGLLCRKVTPSLRGWALIAGGVLSIVAFFQGLRPPVVESYEVALAGLPAEMDGTVLVAMSDLHVGSQIGGRWLEARIAQVQAEDPDLVVLLGDLFEGHGISQTELLGILRGLSAPLGVWSVLGNHEFHGGRSEESVTVMEEADFQVLRNRWAEIRSGFILAGVDDLTSWARAGKEGDPVLEALAKNRPSGATILLSHTPWQTEKAASAGAGLMLCGHTHGGQIWPFSYLVRRSYPLLEGFYEVEGMPVIVCRGTGTWGPRMRLWHPGEILRVTLREKAGVAPFREDV